MAPVGAAPCGGTPREHRPLLGIAVGMRAAPPAEAKVGGGGTATGRMGAGSGGAAEGGTVAAGAAAAAVAAPGAAAGAGVAGANSASRKRLR